MGLLDYLENEDYSDVITPNEEEIAIDSAVYFINNNDSSDEGNLLINDDEVILYSSEEETTVNSSFSEEQFLIVTDYFNDSIEHLVQISDGVEVMTAFVVAVGTIKIVDYFLKLLRIRKEGDL